MDEQLKSNISSSACWIRLLFMILFAICLQVASVVMGAVIIIQFLFVLISGERNQELRRFGATLAEYFFTVLNFLTYNSDEKPFPFSEWPSADASADASTATEPREAEVKKQAAAPEDTAVKSASEASSDTPEAKQVTPDFRVGEEPVDPGVTANVVEEIERQAEENYSEESHEKPVTKPRRQRTRKSDNKNENQKKNASTASSSDEVEKT